ncbi:glycyl radical protein [Thermoanaerobacteraceae bacterium SP2]|nr:glycyl radical protein [Thermoanaerobacteraceae bacterium SP2]
MSINVLSIKTKMNYVKPLLSPQIESRIKYLKDESLNVIQEVCVERARYLTETYKSTVNEPMIIRRAKALKNILENMTVFIGSEELIVGNQASKLRAAPIFPEYAVDWIIQEIDELPKRSADKFEVPAEVKEELLDICHWWQGKTVEDRCMATLPEEVKQAYNIGVLSARGNMTSGDGHIMLDFPKVLKVGVKGIIDECNEALASLEPTDPESFKKRMVLQSIIIAYKGVINFAHRYSVLAKQLSEMEKDERRSQELLEIARICKKVPENPPESFHEALQTVWFMHLISQIESNGHSMSLGRFDQYMYEFYLRDKESGKITEEQVVELLACLWIKMFGITKIRPWSHTRFSAGGPTYQNLTLGGITPEGKDATNELTLLCLDSVALTRLPQPNVSARFHPNAPSIYLRKCVEVIKLGFGMPAMHNDELMIPSLLSRGVALEDANNYAIVGCIEPIIPGKHGYRAAGMSFTNFPKILELALNNGRDPKTGIQLCPGNGDLSTFNSFDDVMEAFKKQMEYYVKIRITGEHVIDYAIEELVPDAFCTGLVQDCIKRGKTPKEGGAVYDMVTGPETGVTNAGNSLAAIKKVVFEEKLLTGKELKDAMDSNFEGNYEQIRQLLLNKAPKFGNDDDFVDDLTNEVYMIFIRELSKYKNTRFGRGPIGGINYPCTATISANVPSGLNVGATPDGRRAREPLAEGCSPYHGTDKLGPTAVVKSVSKMPNILITGGNLLNLKINPSSLKTEEGMQKLESLIRTFFELKGWHVQFNVISSDILREAKKNPEKYKDLVVRVAGYSALFTNLEPATQDDIIARTEHSL